MNTPITKRVQDAMGAQARSAAQQTRNHSAREQKAIEAKISGKYNNELYRKQLEIQSRTYNELGIGKDYKGSKTSPEYQRLSGIAAGRVAKRMANNKGPNEIRAKRDAELKASRDAYEAMPSTQARKRSAAPKQVTKGHEGQYKKTKYPGKISNIEKRKDGPGYVVTTTGGKVNPENLKHAVKHGKGKRAMSPKYKAKTSTGNVIKY